MKKNPLWRPSLLGVRDFRKRAGAPMVMDRRTVLRGFAKGALMSLALPPLEAMMGVNGNAYAATCDASGFPKRFVLWFWGNGMHPDRWTPEAEGDDWELSEQLAPLQEVKDQLCVVTGMSVKTDNIVPHGSGCAGILSGSPIDGASETDTFAAPSIDQVIADEVGSETLYSSIVTAASDADGRSYNGPNSKNPPETSPIDFYERLFGDSFYEPGEEGEVDPRYQLRRSVLDATMEDIKALESKVGAADKERLEQHYEGVYEIEQRLKRLIEDPPNMEACERPAEPEAAYDDVEGRPQLAERNAVMSDLVTMALACDQTRVAAHFFTDPINGLLFPDASAGHHDLTHNEAGDQPEVNAITTYCMEQLGVFVEKLASIPEGDGTMLDNMVVFATSEHSMAQTHDIDEMPILLFGNCCGFFRTNYHYRSLSGDNASKVLFSLQRAMDMGVSSFGTEDMQTSEGLSGIQL